jgi:hypothetical protein
MSEAFRANQYLIRRKFFTIFGAKFHIYDPEGRLIGFSKQKAFKLKEDIRVYTDETMEDECLLIKARQIVDFSAAYDVVDPYEDVKLGALRRKGWSSIFRDSWEFLNDSDRPIGNVQEDSAGLAFVRRFLLGWLLPQSFHATVDGEPLATYRVHLNPFVHKMTVKIEPDASDLIDSRLLLAAGILLVAIEGRQQ